MRSLDPSKVQRLLVLRTSAIGDVVHNLPAVSALRELFPHAEIDWLVESLSAPLLDDHPHLSQVHVLPRSEWRRRGRRASQWLPICREFFALVRTLRRRRYDLVIDFQGNSRSALALLLAGGRQRVGFHRADVGELAAALVPSHRPPAAPPRMNKILKNLFLVQHLGYEGPCPRGEVELTPEHRRWARRTLDQLPERGPAVVLHPVVSRFGTIKRWPIAHFRGLVDRLSEIGARVLITWGPGERDIAASIGRPHVLDESVGLRHFAALLAEADLVVAADTGALPLAAVLDTPVVGLFGPKDAAMYTPPGLVEVVTSPAPCSPCRLRRCEHSICMTLISPTQVYESALRALQRAKVAKERPCPDRF